jgi:glutamate dehydrogenase (NAD(P)+)
MRNEYENIIGKEAPAVITGKPVSSGGSLGRNEATAMGAYYIIRKHTSPTSVLIQGFGNAGSIISKLLSNDGYKIVGVSDSKGGVISEAGLDIDKLIEHKKNSGSVINFNNAKTISNHEFLRTKTDILIPAALGGSINSHNVLQIKAKQIFEVANGPVLPDAMKYLEQRGVEAWPDILVNAGGVTVSYFEWLQNLNNEKWTKDEVFSKLSDKMLTAYDEVLKVSEKQGLDLRTASYKVAVMRLIESYEKI